MNVHTAANGFDGSDYTAFDQAQQQQTPQKNSQQQQPKALRFVTNYGAPHPKRRRIAAACLTCRKRKTACSGERPTCETCRQNKLECAGYSSDAPAPAPGQKRTYSECNDEVAEQHQQPSPTATRKSALQQPQQDVKQEQEVDVGLGVQSYNNNHDDYLQSTNWLTSDATTNLGNDLSHTMSNTSATNLPNEHVQQDTEVANENASNENESTLFSGGRNRMPYFRWLGPTAIMPGFKQMVVKVKRQDTDMTRMSNDGLGGGGGGGVGSMTSPSLSLNANGTDGGRAGAAGLYGSTPGAAAVESGGDARSPLNLPFYDTSPTPPSELITHLAQTFFTHLGCNYPFLQRERFMRDLEEKQVDAILVDAVCALAARFSTHSLITQQTSDSDKTSPAEYGHAFAQRAQKALVDTFPCPTVAAVQAALLLAYNEFGENRDSGLWMYLGISIRMAQDLGLHKIEGLKYKGKTGPTPKMIKKEAMSGVEGGREVRFQSQKKDKDEALEKRRESDVEKALKERDKVVKESKEGDVEVKDQAQGEKENEEQKAVEQERVDTFWAVFFLDRCVSSGTGRRSTIRDKDVELSFPALDSTDEKSGWPAPFPALIRIIHLYGRVADLLNSIKGPSDITWETPKRLASMESQVTNFYQGLSPRLHFDAVNFQHYMKTNESTNFVLLHFWFHTLIVLLHQPTLLLTFEGRMLQLFPNSNQLSMSSAKTIADILSYSQLMDAKASLGNPFTTQPIYIAACAFLREAGEQSASSNTASRDSSPSRRGQKEDKESKDSEAAAELVRPGSSANGMGTPVQSKRMSIDSLSNPPPQALPTNKGSGSSLVTERHKSSDKSMSNGTGHSSVSAAKTASALAKHTLLATAASQHYQLCYKALESLYTYWAGTKYILTVLDQKFKGVRDPLLYTVEESESAMEQPRPEPSFTSPGWRRKLSWETYLYGPNVRGSEFWREKAGLQMQMAGSPSGDPSTAIGWTLTGTMNSPNTNLAWHFPSATSAPMATGSGSEQGQSHGRGPGGRGRGPQQASGLPGLLSMASSDGFAPQTSPPTNLGGAQPQASMNAFQTNGNAATSSDYLVDLNSPYQNSNNPASTPNDPFALHPTTSHQSGVSGVSGTAQHNQQAQAHQQPNDFTSVDPSATTTNNQHNHDFTSWNYGGWWDTDASNSMQPFGDMMIESQDVDMSMLGLEMMPWFEPTEGFGGFWSAQASPNDGTGGAQQSSPQG